jgi:hypothetical protein
MKRILILALALIVVLSFSATRAQAADYGTWLFLKLVIDMDHSDQLTQASGNSVATATAVTADNAKQKVITHRDGEGLAKRTAETKDRPANAKEWRLSRR